MADQDNVIPCFYLRSVYKKGKSKQEGRPIYEDQEYVQMLIPGDKNEIPDMPVKDEHKERWPDQYKRFKEKQEPTTSGTPLHQWPEMTPARVSALKDINVFTVEQMANLNDVALKQVGPDGHELKRRAQNYLEVAEGVKSVEEMDELKARLDALESENKELKKNQKKKPGRPRKKQAAKKEDEAA